MRRLNIDACNIGLTLLHGHRLLARPLQAAVACSHADAPRLHPLRRSPTNQRGVSTLAPASEVYREECAAGQCGRKQGARSTAVHDQ